MIARLKAIAAAALVVATLTGLATGLAATGIGGDDSRPAGSRRSRRWIPPRASSAASRKPARGR